MHHIFRVIRAQVRVGADPLKPGKLGALGQAKRKRRLEALEPSFKPSHAMIRPDAAR